MTMPKGDMPTTNQPANMPNNGASPHPPVAPPPSPKVQAVTLAIELAKVRATTGPVNTRATTVDQLLADADAIATFIGKTQTVSF